MSSIGDSESKPAQSYFLLGVGAWAWEDRDEVTCNKTREQGASARIRCDTSNESTGELNRTGTSDQSGRDTLAFKKTDAENTGMAHPSKYSDPNRMDVIQSTRTTRQGVALTIKTTPTKTNMSSITQFRQLHHYLSAPAKCDPWHGMDDKPSLDGSTNIKEKLTLAGRSSPSSLRSEYGSDMD